MSFPVQFWHFHKKTNSTARPTAAPANTFMCEFIDGTNIITPQIRLEWDFSNGAVRPGNYCLIEILSRYYFVDNYTYTDNGYLIASLKSDPLASFKDGIGGHNLYILRSSKDFDGDIIDTTYPTTQTVELSKNSISNPWSAAIADYGKGMIVAGLVGSAGIKYYYFWPEVWDNFLHFIFSDAYADLVVPNFTEIYKELKTQVNPTQYIASARWYPFRISGGTSAVCSVGWVDIPTATDTPPDNLIVSKTYDIPMTGVFHPQSPARGKYLNGPPYSQYELFFPPFGKIPLPASIMMKCTRVSVSMDIDLRTGMAHAKIYGIVKTPTATAFKYLLTTVESMFAVNIEVTHVQAPGMGAGDWINSGAQAVSAVADSVGAVGSAIMAPSVSSISGAVSRLGSNVSRVSNNIADAAGRYIPTATKIGSVSGLAALKGEPSVQGLFFPVTPEDREHHGRPLCQVRNVRDLGGYMMVQNADVHVSGTEQEDEYIRSMLEGGFYFE